jgi:hypothetical protein
MYVCVCVYSSCAPMYRRRTMRRGASPAGLPAATVSDGAVYIQGRRCIRMCIGSVCIHTVAFSRVAMYGSTALYALLHSAGGIVCLFSFCFFVQGLLCMIPQTYITCYIQKGVSCVFFFLHARALAPHLEPMSLVPGVHSVLLNKHTILLLPLMLLHKLMQSC